MVRKLLKHELAWYVRLLIPMNATLLVLAVFGRFIQLFETDSIWYTATSVSAFLAYGAAIFAVAMLTTVLIVVRFYKNLFTGEGYLSFTLPVTAGQHINVKILAALLADELNAITTLLSLVIILDGEVLAELWKAVAYLFKLIPPESRIHFPFYGLEMALLLVATSLGSRLLLYACMAMGQLFNKARIFMSVVIYYAIYTVTQLLSTSAAILSVAIPQKIMEAIGTWIGEHAYLSGHLFLVGTTLGCLVLAGICYAITHTVIRKRLNLE